MSGAFDEFIVVGNPTKKTGLRHLHRANGLPVGSPRAADRSPARRFIAEEVIPFVEKSWRTDGRRTRVGEMPPLSPEAQADKKIPCTAERVTFAGAHADPRKWEAFCILSPVGQAPTPREKSRNWKGP
jgi:hypothetical protein